MSNRVLTISGFCPACGSTGPKVRWSAPPALERILADREAELLAIKGPCSNERCRLHYAHRGPCDSTRPEGPHDCGRHCHPLRASDGQSPACSDDCQQPLGHAGLCDERRRPR